MPLTMLKLIIILTAVAQVTAASSVASAAEAKRCRTAVTAHDQGSSSKNGFYFGPGFDPAFKKLILWNLFKDPGDHCYGESERWRARLVRKLGIPASDVVLRTGVFWGSFRPKNDLGNHYWLEVRGVIFDPTAFQYQGVVPLNEFTPKRYDKDPRFRDPAERYRPDSQLYDLNPLREE